MTTDLLELDAGAPDLLEAAEADGDADEVYRCGCADCRALRSRGAEPGHERGMGDG